MNNQNSQHSQICYEDEIDLRELFLTIWRYKKFLFSFTFFVTFLSLVYVFVKKPIYKIEATLKPAHTIDGKYFLTTSDIKIYLDTIYNKNRELNYTVEVTIPKKNKDYLHISIEDYSNELALKRLNTIKSLINSIEDKKIKLYKEQIKNKLYSLQKVKENLLKDLKLLKSGLNNVKDPILYTTVSNNIASYEIKIQNIDSNIKNLKLNLQNIKKTEVVGDVIKSDKPIKPKKNLIVIVAFITSLILGIFLIFFIEFIKGFKEEIK